MNTVAVLFARRDSVYKKINGLDVYDEDRDARTFCGNMPVIAHPPCRAWGRLRKLANPAPGEKDLAFFAVDQVRKCGGVLEHPAGSLLWDEACLPRPGRVDHFFGWTLPIVQFQFGHRANKPTWLYFVGIDPSGLPVQPFRLGTATHVIGASGRRRDGKRILKGSIGWRPEVSKAEREYTPHQLAAWLVAAASVCKPWRAA
jgi:hypothetical protein